MMDTKVCRLCLADDSDLEFRSVFEDDISIKLRLCTGVIVRPTDVISTNICSACCCILLYFSKFKNKCVKNNKILNKMARELDNEIAEDSTEEEEDEQDEMTSSEIKEKLLDNNGVLVCPFCLKTGYTNKATLEHHIKYYHNDKVHQLYDGVKNRICKYCPNRKFDSLTRLNKHIKEAHHTKVYRCRICKKAFFKYEHCYNHLSQRHFIKNVNRGDSILVSTPVFKFKHNCTICDKKFPNWLHLKQHCSKTHLQINYCCPICFKANVTQSDLLQHIQDFHKKTKTDGEDTQEIEMIVVKEELIIPDVQAHIPDQLVEVKKEQLLEEEVDLVFKGVKQQAFEGEVTQMLVDVKDEFTIQSVKDHQQPSSSNSLETHKEMEECTLSKEEIKSFIERNMQKLEEYVDDNNMKAGPTKPSLQQRAMKINQQQQGKKTSNYTCTFCNTRTFGKKCCIYHLVQAHFQRVSQMLESSSVPKHDMSCKICHRTFKSLPILERHMKVHALM